MIIRGKVHRICVVVRMYPVTVFWLLACASFAAGFNGNLYILITLMAAQLLVIGHVVRRMWSPALLVAFQAEPGRTAIPTQPAAPGIERHRHARRH